MMKNMNEMIIIDFELYEQQKNYLVISEIGVSKVNLTTNEITLFHALLYPPKYYKNIVSAKYVSRQITSIPILQRHDIEYVDHDTAVLQLKSFIGNTQFIFAKDIKTEVQVLHSLQINLTVFEVYPALCALKGYGLFSKQIG